MTLVGETRLQADFTEAQFRRLQQRLRSLEESLQNVLMGTGAGRLLKELGEMK